MLTLKKITRVLVVTAVFGTAVVMLSRCGKNTGSDSPPSGPYSYWRTLFAPASGTFTHVWENMLQTTCQTCHTPGASAQTTCPAIKIDFTSKRTAYDTLVGKKDVKETVSCADVKPGCNDVPLIEPGKPTKSYTEFLVGDKSITGTPKAGCTPYAHDVLVPGITAANLKSLKDWIKADAKDN